MSFFKITLNRSAIGLPKSTQLILQTLGLRRRTQTVYHRAEPQFAGMIMKVKELVSVEEVDRAQTTREMRDSRKPEPGYYVEKLGPTSEALIKTLTLEAAQKQSRDQQLREAKKAASSGDVKAQAEYLRLLMAGEKDVKATMER